MILLGHCAQDTSWKEFPDDQERKPTGDMAHEKKVEFSSLGRIENSLRE